ncbi:hypothetical protein [Colwellia asteriadis]
MKKIFACIALSAPLFSYAFEHGKVYYSFDSENEARVIVVPAEEDNHYYINYRNFNHHYDNQTLLYKQIKNNINEGFYYQLADTARVNLRNELNKTLIHGTLYSYSTVFLDDDSKTKIIYAGDADIVQARNVKEAYHKRQLDVSSKVAAKKLIKSAQENFNSACKQAVNIDIDWNAFVSQELKAAPAKLSSYLGALSKICAIDSDYLEAVNSITQIKVSPAEDTTQQKVTLADNQLTIQIASEQPNLPETSYQAIFTIL